MKTIIINIIFLFLFLGSSIAQFEYDNDGNLVPFSLSEKYKYLIDTSNITTCVLPSFDNDSLYWEANFENKYVKNNFRNKTTIGFPIDTIINFKAVASKYKLGNGTLWLYKITSNTAENVGFICNNFSIPKGALWSFYSSDLKLRRGEPQIYNYEKFVSSRDLGYDMTGIRAGNSIFIEYFEPINPQFSPKIEISKLSYGFGGVKKKDLKTLPHHLKKSFRGLTLKGAAGSGSDCQYDVVCPGVPDFREEAKSVCYFEYWYFNENASAQNKSGTGFFINKGGNYGENDKPYFITAGHCFDSKNKFGEQINFSQGIDNFVVEIHRRNKKCNDSDEYTYGTALPNAQAFKVVKLGDSYNKESGYVESEDYAIIQAAGTVNDYAKHDILYCGWVSQLYSNSTDWVAIGHTDHINPSQKIFVDNDRPEELSNGANGFSLNFEKGLTVEGVSGAPVFNYKRQAVGWICAVNNNSSCAGVGTNQVYNRTYCGGLQDAYSSINQFIDPLRKYSAGAYKPTIPTVPTHCKNCRQDADKGETAMDCGGPCLPCGISNHKIISQSVDIQNKVKAKHLLSVQPQNGNEIALKTGNYIFEAGEEMVFNEGFVLDYGVDFTASINKTLLTEPEQGCQAACIFLHNAFSPNGDGINDFWGFNHAFVKSYSVVIFDRNNKVWFRQTTKPVTDGNGTVFVWNGRENGTGVFVPPTVYFVQLTYTDCFGVTRRIDGNIHVFGTKKGTVSAENILSKTEIVNDGFNIIPTLNVYPNPTNGRLVIDYKNLDVGYEYVLYDQSGKTVIKDCGNDRVVLDLSKNSPGIYYLKINVENEYQVRKIIKR